MSRLLKEKIDIPDTVKVEGEGYKLRFTGSAGSVDVKLPVGVSVVGSSLVLAVSGVDRSIASTAYVLLRNAITDVVKKYFVSIKMVGVGYGALVSDGFLRLSLGFSHNVFIAIPAGLSVEVKNDVEIIVSSCDRCSASSFAGLIRNFRTPEPYKGKGIFVNGENILRKEGKRK